jgi:hypothetical protein
VLAAGRSRVDEAGDHRGYHDRAGVLQPEPERPTGIAEVTRKRTLNQAVPGPLGGTGTVLRLDAHRRS